MNKHPLTAWLMALYAYLPAKKIINCLTQYRSLMPIESVEQDKLQALGFTAKQLENLQAINHQQIEKDLLWLQQHSEVSVLTLIDADYPPQLLEINSPPLLLFVQGDVALLKQSQLAMVGSRRASGHGKELALQFAKALTLHGLLITSGMALGIDAASHRGALQAGSTIAVVGTGLAQVYPRQHQELAAQIASHGAVVSEFPPFVGPQALNFPRRNRIISGLSLGVLVVEATLRSGSLITAKLALEQGRDVFAVPGHIYNDKAHGCHALIQNGAKLVASIDDILQEMGSFQSLSEQNSVCAQKNFRKKPSCLDKDQQSVLHCVDDVPTSLDVIMMRSGLTSKRLSAMLLSLEAQGVVQRVVGGYQKNR